MEEWDQAYGYALYRTTIAQPADGEFLLPSFNDHATIYLNGKFVETMDRRLKQTKLHIFVNEANAQLDVLVGNTGRANFTRAIQEGKKGLTGPAYFNGKALTNWSMYGLPMYQVEQLKFSEDVCTSACYYQAKFFFQTVGDTYLDTGGMRWGFVWIIGRPLGRAWSIGPQQTLFIHQSWLHRGEKVINVFGEQGSKQLTFQGLVKPILDAHQ